MNDPTNRQAMIAVERVVRPVRASLARKRRMLFCCDSAGLTT